MKRILILYASSTGNTEEIASLLDKSIDRETFEVVLKNLEMEEVDATQLTQYDGILFGTYTYDDGDLPFETDIFCDNLAAVDLSGKVVGLFGSGDTAYSLFCQAVDTMKTVFAHAHAEVLETAVKIDLDPYEPEDFAAIQKLSREIQHALSVAAAVEENGP